ncbi:hypothetical protein H113_06799 [Trichophyton rubrum MR1459]|nr:hypothetical protein H113_06799 [Trichophyton rubrum MR1459]
MYRAGRPPHPGWRASERAMIRHGMDLLCSSCLSAQRHQPTSIINIRQRPRLYEEAISRSKLAVPCHLSSIIRHYHLHSLAQQPAKPITSVTS